ncbi:hypothetical protein HDU93_000651 [Gonapodya sp. JEL0774]|nr:hypothetical protein HDU93_000651 [Gonapodya sp. JEL0774]
MFVCGGSALIASTIEDGNTYGSVVAEVVLTLSGFFNTLVFFLADPAAKKLAAAILEAVEAVETVETSAGPGLGIHGGEQESGHGWVERKRARGRSVTVGIGIAGRLKGVLRRVFVG